MGLFDNREELKTMQIYIDRYAGIKEDMNKLDAKIDNINQEVIHTRNVLLIVITLFGIFIPLSFNLHSGKFEAKFETLDTKISGIEKRVDKLDNQIDYISNKLDLIIKKLK